MSGKRGFKVCKSCGLEQGVRSFVCKNCKTPFVKKTPEPKQEVSPKQVSLNSTTDEQPKEKTTRNIILIPSGPCPVVYDEVNYTEENIKVWGYNVMLHGFKNGKIYSPQALLYWSRCFVEYGSKEYNYIKEALMG